MTALVEAATPTSPVKARSNRTLWLGLLLLAALIVLAIAGPWFVADPYHQDLGAVLQPPSGQHWAGTDQLGRDVFARVVNAASVDLRIGVLAVVGPLVIGTVIGTVAGYRGGVIDTVVMRVVDLVVAFPFYVLVLAVVFVLGAGERTIYVAIGLVGWVSYARIARGATLSLRGAPFVEAAVTGGLPHTRVVVRHVLPNTITQSLVYAMSDVIQVILAVATLSYLGLGINPPQPEWGLLISEGQQFMGTAPLMCILPGAAIVAAGLAFSLIGDGLAHRLQAGS